MALQREIRTLQERSKDLEGVLDSIRSLPEEAAQDLFKRLRNTSDPASVLRTHRPSEQVAARAILPPISSDQEFELSVLHPVAYPLIHRIDENVQSLGLIETIGVDKGGGFQTTSGSSPAATSGSFTQIPTDDSQQTTTRPAIDSARPDGVASLAFGPSKPNLYEDERLHELYIRFWTEVDISNELAASAIDVYLQHSHPAIGCFDAHLFIEDLISCRTRFCSAFLVHCLLAYALVSDRPVTWEHILRFSFS